MSARQKRCCFWFLISDSFGRYYVEQTTQSDCHSKFLQTKSQDKNNV